MPALPRTGDTEPDQCEACAEKAQGRTEEEQRRETRKEGCLELRGRRSLVRCRGTLSAVAACQHYQLASQDQRKSSSNTKALRDSQKALVDP